MYMSWKRNELKFSDRPKSFKKNFSYRCICNVLYRGIFEFLCKTVFPNSLQLSPLWCFRQYRGSRKREWCVKFRLPFLHASKTKHFQFCVPWVSVQSCKINYIYSSHRHKIFLFMSFTGNPWNILFWGSKINCVFHNKSK